MRGAIHLLNSLEEEGRVVRRVGSDLNISPGDDLHPGDIRFLTDLKPELLALLGFTREQRAILARHGDVDLADLDRYAQGLEVWLRFTPGEQAALTGFEWRPEDLTNLEQLKAELNGQVVGAGATN